ncbi:MAG: M1 family metallopeptidase [Bacteroidetes bacterium]|nr:M1 family metallopeptidase [Bacteroidota bacterium]
MACEGFGASSWWPCKDHLSDEPESMVVKISAPKGMVAIANGRLVQVDTGRVMNKFIWKVVSPINTYNVNISIGDYVHFSDTFISRKDAARLDLDYWVLSDHLEKAKEQFKQVKPMLVCYEEKLGKYPFYDDSYKLVETPYLGMEHQSCIAYGNGYKKGYAGNTKMTNGHEFDYIIIHESGHEWFGNNISCADIADMWIHEAFTTYTESIFVECNYGKEKAVDYINSKFERIGNKAPMVGIYGVNEEGAGDMYSKGSLFLNTLRHIIDHDSLWWSILYDMNTVAFHHKTIGYSDVLNYFNQRSGRDFTKIFEQYLKYPSPPKLKYSLTKIKGKTFDVSMQWETDVVGFEMPIVVLTKKGVYEKVKVSESSPTRLF